MTYSILDQTTSVPSAPKPSHTHTALPPSPSNPQTPCVYPETLRSIAQHPGPRNSHKHTDSSCSSPLYITHTHIQPHHKSHTLLAEECSSAVCVWLHHVIECLVNIGKVCLKRQRCLMLCPMLHLVIFMNKSDILRHANGE